MKWNAATLDDYIRLVDQAGGPGSPACQEIWKTFEIELRTTVDQSLDPYSEEYVAQQIAVYEELSGHRYDRAVNEFTDFDMAAHTRASNPYAHPDPGGLALHVQRLSRAFGLASPELGQTLIDLGCGWGLSSEIAAYLGLEVQAVDVNPKFVELVNRRADASGAPITATTSPFEDFKTEKPGNLILFYESLHHAVRPWKALRNVLKSLRPGGKLIIAGEPINDNWWINWGIRLDPESVYCIRKFGWFESGWSKSFLLDMVRREGLDPEIYPPEDPRLGDVVIAIKPPLYSLNGSEVLNHGGVIGGYSIDGPLLGLFGQGTLRFTAPDGLLLSQITIASARPAPLAARFSLSGEVLFDGTIQEADVLIHLSAPSVSIELDYKIETWVPDAEIGNGDHREIGAHLRRFSFADHG